MEPEALRYDFHSIKCPSFLGGHMQCGMDDMPRVARFLFVKYPLMFEHCVFMFEQ